MTRLTDEQWERIRDHFLEENIADGRAGRKPTPTRCVLEAVLWILDTGAQWHVLPQSYPNYKTVHRRFQTWCRDEVLRRVLTDVADELRNRGALNEEECFIDATFVMAKVSVATTVKHSAGEQFVSHVAALPGNPYDGHTLATVIPQMQAVIGNVLDRCIADAGYRRHNAPPEHKFKVYTSGQKRRVTPQIKREFKRRAAIEPVIGHLKEHHRMGRNYLAHASGGAINAVLAAAGYNFRRLLAWLRFLWLRILIALGLAAQLKLA
jgi:transposase